MIPSSSNPGWWCRGRLSSSKMSYKEMALVNIAFCYGQLGEGEKAREYYNAALKENPNNGMAIAALKLLDSAQNLNTKG